MNRQLRMVRRGDGGYSLIEMLVAMAIAMVVLGLVTTTLIGSSKASTGARARLANVDEVRTAMDSISRTLRTGVRPEQLNPTCVTSCSAAFVSATDNSVVIYANLGDVDPAGKPAPTRMTYTIAADPTDPTGKTAAITETRQLAASAPSSTPGDYTWGVGTSRMVGNGLTWPIPAGSAPLFVYYNGTHTKLATTPAITGSALATITSVDITLPVGDATHPTAGAATSVFLPNSTLGH